MNIKMTEEKKEYVVPQMTVMDMKIETVLCASGDLDDTADAEGWDNLPGLN
ncbi:hypothetical protein SAMN05720766_1067 [Fibrobacter sp. UWH9]|uniref:hypothetical protein n=1 Tax=Fibrobacter sp. UWH9 TaxID=1896213 RepID=UPI00091AF0F4|nr:hypothetical protein [Fibrobacter sp. UWH9]SHH00836.1 hypothetical protein SAMN05720766_1067 [Fibrobacter sp. UWH9]